MMELGDNVYEAVSFGDYHPVMAHGRVVYIHPEKRFYVAELQLEGGKVREAYPFVKKQKGLDKKWK